MPPTTTFADIEMTETLENYTYENTEYTFEKGDIVSLPHHTANRIVNQWEKAVYSKEPYEVKQREYEDFVGRIRNKDQDEEPVNDEDGDEDEVCETVKSDGEVCGREKPCPYHDEQDE